MKQKFMGWYAKQVTLSLEKRTPIEEIDVELKISIMKPLHAYWIISYNHMTSAQGRSIVVNGWRRAGIPDAVLKGSKKLVPLDPFLDIDPMLDVPILLESPVVTPDQFVCHYTSTNIHDDNSEDEWEDENGIPIDLIDDDSNTKNSDNESDNE